MGGDTKNNVTAGNVQCLLNLVQNVHKVDVAPFSNIAKALEIDINVDVSTSGPTSGSGNKLDVISILLTGGGTGGAYQGDASYGIVFQRSTCNWFMAIDISACYFWLQITARNTAVTVCTQYTAPPGSPVPSRLFINRGVAFDNLPGGAPGSQLMAVTQLSNNSDAIWISRKTDSSPTGTYLAFTRRVERERPVLCRHRQQHRDLCTEQRGRQRSPGRLVLLQRPEYPRRLRVAARPNLYGWRAHRDRLYQCGRRERPHLSFALRLRGPHGKRTNRHVHAVQRS